MLGEETAHLTGIYLAALVGRERQVVTFIEP